MTTVLISVTSKHDSLLSLVHTLYIPSIQRQRVLVEHQIQPGTQLEQHWGASGYMLLKPQSM